MNESLTKKRKSGGCVCCVPGCRSNSKLDRDVSFSIFPKQKRLRKLWLERINRQGEDGKYSSWTPTQYHKVCGLHFNSSGKRKYGENVPSIFPHKTFPEKRELKRPAPKDRTNTGPNVEVEIDRHEEMPAPDSSGVGNMYTAHNLSGTDHRYTLPPNCEQLRLLIQQKHCQMEMLTTENGQLLDKITQLNSQLETCKRELDYATKKIIICDNEIDNLKKRVKSQLFCVENVSQDKGDLKFYTGFEKIQEFEVLFKYLEADLPYLNLSVSGTTFERKTERGADVRGRPMSLSFKNQLFLVLCRLRVGLLEKDLAFRFQISEQTVSNYCTTWIDFLYIRLTQIPIWPTKAVVKKYLPDEFKDKYPNTTAIADCTEVFIEKPADFKVQSETYSQYKSHNTAKGLLVMAPNGFVTFVSNLYGGRASDKQITFESGLLDKLQPGDSVMADRGFDIEEMLAEKGVSLNIPPFLNGKPQLSKEEEILTREIATLRIHVERVIGRVKDFRILKYIFPNSMSTQMNKIWKVCCYLLNFSHDPLLKSATVDGK